MRIAEERILEEAVLRGYIARERLLQLNPGGTDPGDWYAIPLLVQSGEIEWESVHEIIRELSGRLAEEIHPETERPIGDATPEIPRQNRYRIDERLGSGAMGEVFRAYDTLLKRPVALKLLKGDLPRLKERFMREARGQAKLRHEHICPIFDTGEQSGRAYIAMPLIEGETLDRAMTSLTLRQKIGIVKSVAEALHAAHQQGLVHRDIKPGNIMIEKETLKPYVMDFGLVRDLAAADLTQSLDIVGSPHYMSPEQAAGAREVIDGRADIFSLGVVLYQLLCKKLPFSGGNLSSLTLAVINRNPVAPRKWDPSLSADTEAVILKCLEKNPDRRYASAGELAGDLGRLLEGAPVQARRTAWPRRFISIVREHRFAAVIFASLLLIALAVSAMSVLSGIRLRHQARIAAEFGRSAEAIESTIRYSYLIQPHPVRTELEKVRKKLDDLKRRMKEIGRAAEGPGHFALGQGYMQLRDFERAATHLQKSWDRGFRTPQAAYSLGKSLGEIYYLEVLKAERINDRELQEARKNELEQRYIRPALSLLRAHQGDEHSSHSYALALIAFYEKRYEDAAKLLERSGNQADSFYEKKILLGDIHRAGGDGKWRKGDYAGSMAEYTLAARFYTQAVEIGRSDPLCYLRAGEMYLKMASVELKSKEKGVLSFLDKAQAYADGALFIDPSLSAAFCIRAAALMERGLWKSRRAEDPSPELESALREAEKAMKWRPEKADAYSLAGLALVRMGEYDVRHNRDPVIKQKKAIDLFGKALSLSPADVSARIHLTRASMTMAYFQILRGRAPLDAISQAVESAERVVEVFPDVPDAHAVRAGAYHIQALHEWYRGGDVSAAADRALASAREAVRLNVSVPRYHATLGALLLVKGNQEAVTGGKADQYYRECISLLEKSLEWHPGYSDLYHCLGCAYCELYGYSYIHGKIIGDFLEKAEMNLRKALSINPGYIETYRYLVRVGSFRMRRAFRGGKDLGGILDSLRAAFNDGCEIHGTFPDFLAEMAAALNRTARFRLQEKRSPLQLTSEADLLTRRSIAAKSDHALSWSMRGEAALIRAVFRQSRGGDAGECFRQSEEHLQQALNCHSTHAATLKLLAELYWRKTVGESRENAAIAAERGVRYADAALAVNRSDAEAMLWKGWLLNILTRGRKTAAEKEKLRLESEELIRRAFILNHNLRDIGAVY